MTLILNHHIRYKKKLLILFFLIAIGIKILKNYHFGQKSERNIICWKTSPLVVYLIKSKISQFEHREAVRKTWAKQDQYGLAKRAFFIGQPNPLEEFGPNKLELLKKEKKTHGDIVQGDFIDAYRNLSLKIKFALKWAHDHCLKTRYFLIADDDTFVNPRLLFNYLEGINLNENQHLYAGWKWDVSSVDRNESSRHYLSIRDYPQKNYPAFINGPFILLSRFTLKTLHEQSKSKLNIQIDDTYLGVLAFRAKIPLTDIDRVLPESLKEIKHYIIFMSAHHLSVEDLLDTWKSFGEHFEIDHKYFYDILNKRL